MSIDKALLELATYSLECIATQENNATAIEALKLLSELKVELEQTKRSSQWAGGYT